MTEHITAEEMLPYLDGELPKGARKKIGRHLESCWTCRREMERLREDIGIIVDAQDAVAGHGMDGALPQSWPRLEPRMEAAKRPGLAMRRPLWTSVACGAVACALLLLWLEPASVSAGEVVRRAQETDARRMQATAGHLVRQRVRVTRVERGEPRKKIGAVDSWRSGSEGYWQFAASDTAAADLQRRYRKRGITQHPLCVGAFQSWSRGLGTEGRVLRSADELQVSYGADGQADGGELRSVTLRVLPDDWHVTGMRLEFSDADFEIAEEELSLLARNHAPEDVLAHLEPRDGAISKPAIRASEIRSGVAPTTGIDHEVPLDGIEMDVLHTLHQLGADLGEPITVAREKSGIVVQAWSVPEGRQQLLRRVFEGKPHVRLDLEPPEVARRLDESKPVSLSSALPEASHTIRAANDERLMEWFGSAAAREEFSRSILAIETEMMVRYYALNALAERWPAGSDRLLPDDARLQLRQMAADHARVAQQRCAELKLLMKPLLDEFAGDSWALVSAPPADWRDAATAGLKSSQAVDLLLGSLFTTSNTVVPLVEALVGVRRALSALEALPVLPHE